MYTRNPTYEGSRAESWFRHECNKRGIIISKPDNDLGRYDFVLDNRADPLMKVQVKKLNYDLERNSYRVRIFNYKKNKNGIVVPTKHYTSNCIDMFVLVGLSGEREENTLVEDCVYFIPVGVVEKYTAITVCPTRETKRKDSLPEILKPYKNAWYFVDGSKHEIRRH